jgi:hydrogenase expression/formation protein HypD
MIRYIDEFRLKDSSKAIARRIESIGLETKATIMEVCGGHTHTIHKYGIHELLPESINLISGPGCPVCVTPQPFIDTAIALSRQDDVIVATFGDMIRVPGTESSLLTERGAGRDVRICLSPSDALSIAQKNPLKRVVFIGIGFETTAPSIALSIMSAKQNDVSNFFVLCGIKTMPEALTALVRSKEVAIDGFICPGHVSAITGLSIYTPLSRDYHIPCVVSGFEPNDILLTIEMLAQQIKDGRAEVENEYTRVVKPAGNPKAIEVLDEVFVACDSEWRGLGKIAGSGFAIREAFKGHDAGEAFSVSLPEPRENKGCLCGKVMSGLASPVDCRLFATACTPESPLGACMVSSEGACGIRFLYRNPKYDSIKSKKA